MLAPPITYSVDGEQYVALLSGAGVACISYSQVESARQHSVAGGKGGVLAFVWAERGAPLPLAVSTRASPQRCRWSRRYDDDRGPECGSYQRYCGGCHGSDAVSGGVLPEPADVDAQLEPAMRGLASCGDGVLADRGMVRVRIRAVIELGDEARPGFRRRTRRGRLVRTAR